MCFERALVVRDLFTGGVRTFFSTADAQHFRSRLYQHYGAPRVPGSVRYDVHVRVMLHTAHLTEGLLC